MTEGEGTTQERFERLRTVQRQHHLWQSRLLKACEDGALDREDFRLIFSQYYLYSKNFTRYLAGFMANCESDYHRARLAENLWEEGGMAAPEARHAEIFRCFLREALNIDVEAIEYIDTTRYFVREYLDFCVHSNAIAGAAFLSLGTEGIVARLYETIVKGLLKAGIPDQQLEFFHLHMECDDDHAETLERIVLDHASTAGWYETCLDALDRAMSLRARFFDGLYDHLLYRRLAGLTGKIQARKSLAPEQPDMAALSSRPGAAGNIALYDNVNERLNIDFAVERVPFPTEVLDVRILRIPPGKNNELHKHPYESLFYVICGKGTVRINQGITEVQAGDLAFVPRWAMHQTSNRGGDELVILAVTDFDLMRYAFLGNFLKSARMKGTQAPRAPIAPVPSIP
ncbi:MAG TPA: iron-containing redox enzyme family protein [Polyangiaceae bacterium]|nr:iron-containing redox enzyme family protein [Polyangiaceae bacterium]